MAEWLIERFPREQEGDLGRRLARLVSQPVLAEVSEAIGLGEVIKVSPGEARAGVRRRATVLADALEAALGALYLDGGLDRARDFVRRAWDGVMTAQADPPKDAKTALQEWVAGARPRPAALQGDRARRPAARAGVRGHGLGRRFFRHRHRRQQACRGTARRRGPAERRRGGWHSIEWRSIGWRTIGWRGAQWCSTERRRVARVGAARRGP